MFIDARTLPAGTTVQADVCIVGAGAAGITLATALPDRHDVVVLESGGFELEAATQGLNAGTDRAGSAEDLSESRLRYLGGSTNHWAGFCAPLEDEDFLSKPWVEHSGWPLRRADLEPFYPAACQICDLPQSSFDPAAYLGADLARSTSADVGLGMWRLSPPTRFGTKFRPLLEKRAARVLLHANAVDILPNAEATRIERIDAKTLAGNAFAIRARHYVLACGGLENPRLLLLSRTVTPRGLGNDHDLVGRFFMDHAEFIVGRMLRKKAPALHRQLYRSDAEHPRLCFTLGPRVRQEEQLLSGCLRLAPPETLRGTTDDSVARLQAFSQDTLFSAADFEITQLYSVQEQSPNPDSRVTLQDTKDALGLNTLVLDWRCNATDKPRFMRSLEILRAHWRQESAAHFKIFEDWQDAPWPYRGGWVGKHHSGTTRMSDDPKRGVVDRDCKVHGLSNLFVAGSSVFCTNSWKPPTLTLTALALRLAEHLKSLA